MASGIRVYIESTYPIVTFLSKNRDSRNSDLNNIGASALPLLKPEGLQGVYLERL